MSKIDIRELLVKTVEEGASDLHICAGIPPMIRVNGNVDPLEGYKRLTAEETQELIYSVMNEEQIAEFETEKECDLSFGLEGFSRFRLNVYRDRGSVVGAFRAIPFSILSFEELGLPRVIADFASRPAGLVLICGPTGCGKSTTLAAIINKINNERKCHIITVEDPIEMVAPELNQMQVQPAIDLTFAQGIRTLLRQDPDIIMVGEIRDLEAAQMAVQAALTGHLVLSTLHTNDAASAVTRLLALGVPYYLIQNVLIGVMAQRLVRTLCPHCKETGQIDGALWEALIRPWPLPKPVTIRAPCGCPECRNTGYLGRIGLYELLTVTPELRRLFRPNMDADELRRRASARGMRPLRVSAALQIAAGLTTFEEVIQILPPLDED